RDLVVQLAREAAAAAGVASAVARRLARPGLAEIGTAAVAAGIADLRVTALSAGIQHLQLAAEFLQYDLGRVAVLAALVLPFAGLQLTLDVNLGAFLQVLLGDLDQIVVEDHDVVPLGLLLALARVLVAPGLAGGDAHADDRIAGIQPPDLRVRP